MKLNHILRWSLYSSYLYVDMFLKAKYGIARLQPEGSGVDSGKEKTDSICAHTGRNRHVSLRGILWKQCCVKIAEHHNIQLCP